MSMNYVLRSSSQDRGIGRYASLPHTTKRKITTNLTTTKKPQNCQKIELYWKSKKQGVKEETFIQTVRRGRDGQ